ncbi:D-TA family PLP-dependent enzyme [Planctomicrobium sp. SH664]|uniref:D-TA family PLP-dependent enzyme n=1 Tax=Planctomicrobium sp. SH664 TaxID=3448125 RepID=UPI003F5B64BC
MSDLPQIATSEAIHSPGLVLFRDRVQHNISAMIALAGRPDRLRPHCKTHKMSAIVSLLLQAGVTRHKAATIAEAEMLAMAGVQDIVLAYNLVGPNIERAVRFRQVYPDVDLTVTADDVTVASQLGNAMAAAGLTIGVLLDLNPGLNRTGRLINEEAAAMYRALAETPGLVPAGFHLYDGHRTQIAPEERRAAIRESWDAVVALRQQLLKSGLPVDRVLCGGSPTFPLYAELNEPFIELCPGTVVLHDSGYSAYGDLSPFQPAAMILTRVISRPAENIVTFDVGTKSVASDPPLGNRLYFPALPDSKQIRHNEEHLVVESPAASRFRPGDWTLAIPRHVCPTIALHRFATIIENGQIVDEWLVTARDRKLTI